MDQPVFTDKSNEPDDDALKTALKGSFAHFKKLRELTSHHKQEWKFYGSSGWLLKVTERKKAVLYMRPMAGWFLAGMALREADRAVLLEADIDSGSREELRTAEKVSEGYPFSVEVKRKVDAERVIEVLRGCGKIG